MAQRAPVAIVGIGCRFPGGVQDVASFWRLLVEGRDAIAEIPADRFDLGHYFDPKPATPGRVMTRWGGFLDGIDTFDAPFFGISPREAERLDPQQRLMLETAWEALEDAGQDLARLEGSDTGVFVGQWLSDFEGRLFADPEGVDFQMTTGSGRYATSGRISYALGLRGPSLTLDTACSSSLAAVQLAVESVRSGACGLALAGGANVILQPHITVAYSQSRMMAPDGRCKFGDARGDGYVRSEGAALVVLKPLERALADGDRVYAVIRGGAINNDGRSSGSMGTPSKLGQEELLRRAYRDAQVDAGQVGYIEAHGTGTRAGDPVELGALGRVLGEGRTAPRARVGSVKTNFGHTEGAAGVAGLVKAALALHHGTIPASLHCREPNPAIDWTALPLEVAREAQAWPRGHAPRLAGVSAFGIAGTNAHVVLEEAPAASQGEVAAAVRDHVLLPLSARSHEALQVLAARYADWIEARAELPLHAIAANAALRRTGLSHRAALLAADRAALVEALRRQAQGEGAPLEPVQEGQRARVCFVVPGQGAQWLGMARELAQREPVFNAALVACDAAMRPWADWSIVQQLAAAPDDGTYRLDQIDVIQPVLVAIAIAYAALWRSLGVEPDAVVGHSMGEVGAACIAGALDLPQAMQIICRRSALMRATSGQGAMALVELSMEDAQARIRGREAQVAVAVSNGPRSSVLSGEPAAVQAVMAELEREGVFCRLVKVDVASHSPQMEPLARALEAELRDLRPQPGSVALHSTVLARRAEGTELDARYWARNLRNPVMFGRTVEGLLADGVTVFVELGPHPVLLPSIEQTAQAHGKRIATIACGRREEPEQATFLAAVGSAWCAGVQVDWARVHPGNHAHLALPLYPWQRERHWVDAAEPVSPGRATVRRLVDEEAASWLHVPRWVDAPIAGGSAGTSPIAIASMDAAAATALSAACAAAGHDARAVALDDIGTLEAGTRVVVLAADDADAAYLPVAALRALGSAVRPLCFVTQGAHALDAKARVAVGHAAAWGAARVVAEEQPGCFGGLVDLDPAAPASRNATQLLAHLDADDGEDQVAFRDGRRHALRLVREPRAASAAPFAWRADAAYLVTGGLGGVAMHLIRDMAANGARRFVLLGRTALPAREQWNAIAPDTPVGRRIRDVRALEAAGLAVHLLAADMADAGQVRAALASYAAQAYPPIRGVVHAAGAHENRLAATMDRAAFDAAVAAKLAGARVLDLLLPDVDAFVLVSSVASLLAQAGQANYAAANAGLDALASDRRARGLPAVSILWSVWKETGLVDNATGARNVEEMARQGILAFAPERGAALFSRLAAASHPAVAVMPMDWAAFKRARGARAAPLFRELLADVAGSGEGESLASALAGANAAERRKLLEPLVRDTVGRVLKIPVARLDPRKALGAMGLNSLMAMELRNRLEAVLGRALSATLAWNHPTVEALVAHLAGEDAPAKPAAPAPAAPATPAAATLRLDAVAEQVAAGSDEDAALALRARKPRKP